MADVDSKANNEDAGGEGIPTAKYDSAAIGPGGQIGPYKLLRILGEGGYGIVYLAERQRPVKRRVALKVIKPGMDTKQVIARFEAERQALALLDHPNIAHVFNAGTTKTGRPYFAMEYVKGVPITEHCDRYKLTIEERLKLFMTVCEAVQYAHQKAIIHRDIKPSNILVAYEGKQAVPMIIDFGVAKALSQSLTKRTLVTEQAQMVGTPEYMSPEQAEMTGQDIDTRTDVYSLGALLYELLTGTLPFDPQTLREAGIEGMRRMIREQDPKAPSAKLSTIEKEKSLSLAQQRRTDARTLGRHLQGELDWITLKAMDKDRTRRYQTAYALREDIQRYLNQEPVLAGPPSAAYKLRKLIVRNKSLAVAVLAVAITLLVGMIGTTAGLILANRERTKAVASRDRAEEEAERNRRLLYVSNMNLAMQAWEVANLDRMVLLLDQHRQPEPGQEDLRGFEWYYLWRLWQSTFSTPILAHEDGVSCVVFSPNGETLASASGSTLTLWDLVAGEQRRILEGHTDKVICAAFSSDGKVLASGGNDRSVILWDSSTGDRLHTLEGHLTPVRLLAFNPNSTTLFSGNSSETIQWDVATGERIDSSEEGGGSEDQRGVAALSPDGKILAVRRETLLDLRDIASGLTVSTLEGHTAWIPCAAFSPNGKNLATGSNDSSVKLWDLAANEERATLKLDAAVTSVAFSRDGKTLAASCAGRTVKLWDIDTNRVTTLKGHASRVSCVAFSPAGDTLASSSSDGTVRLWSATANVQDCEILKGHTGFVWGVAISPDGKLLASAGNQDETLKLWSTGSPALMESYGLGDKAWCVAFSPDGKSLAVGTTPGGVKLWDVASRREVATLPASVTTLAFSPDGNTLATRVSGLPVVVWDVVKRQQVGTIAVGPGRPFNSLAFSPNSKALAVCNRDKNGSVTVWDMVSMGVVGELEGTGQLCVGFSPDGKTLASGSGDGTVRLWDMVALDGRHIILKGHVAAVNTVAFSPDGNTLASGSGDGTVKLWNLTMNQEVATLRGDTGAIGCLVFSPDGKTLITSSADATIRLWRAATEEDVVHAETQRQRGR